MYLLAVHKDFVSLHGPEQGNEAAKSGKFYELLLPLTKGLLCIASIRDRT